MIDVIGKIFIFNAILTKMSNLSSRSKSVLSIFMYYKSVTKVYVEMNGRHSRTECHKSKLKKNRTA